MMRFIVLLALLLPAFIEAQIETTIATLQDSEPDILATSTIVFNVNSYQAQARNSAMAVLSSPTELQIRNYYALACIYYATNGVPNPRTTEFIPGATIPKWSIDDWINTATYCDWFGVTCNPSNEVVGIDLHENSIFGIFPNEVVLLKTSLQLLELFNNAFLYSAAPKWLSGMGELKYLYFGSTAFTHEGIPTELSGATNLIELDCSNSLWRNGPIRAEAFDGLVNLEYLDLGNNFYTNDGETGAPEFASKLDMLTNLYIDNVKFTPNPLKMDFLVGLPSLLECWMDFTKFEGGIPTSLGLITTLSSFSCTYCDLDGTIPTELGNTGLDRLWLYANKLTGSVPSQLGNLDMKFLFLEENQLTGVVPQSICNRRSQRLTNLGVDCDDSVTCSCCTCCGEACGNLEEVTPAPTGAPTTAPTTGGGVFCFSGDSEVDIENMGPVKMTDLAIGDSVKVADNTFEPIYSFGHKSSEATAEYLQIATEGNRKPLELSKDHMVVVEGGRNVPASMVKRGDKLVTSGGELVAVKTIRNVVRKGAYAPFTASGSIIVNDVVASNYVAFQGAEYIQVAGVSTPFSYQWVAHTFNSVHRVAYKMGFTGESYSDSGVSQWVAAPHVAGTWLLEQNFMVALALLIPAIALFGSVSLFEAALNSPMTAATCCMGALTSLAVRQSVGPRVTKKL